MHRNASLPIPQPTLERWYTLMGEALLFQTNHPLLLEYADESFGRFPACPPGSAQPLVARLLVVESSHPQPGGAHSLPVYHTQEYLFHFQVGPDNFVVSDLQGGFAFGQVTPALVRERAFVRVTFVEAMCLSMLMLSRNFSPLHATCVIKNGTSIILQGKNNTGKSTLAYACARRGYQVLTEDVVHIKVRPDSVTLWGSPWKLHLLPDAKQFFPELASLEPELQMNGEWKLEIDMEQTIPGSMAIQAQPGLMVMAERGTGGPTRIEPISLSEAMAHSEIIWPWQTGWTAELERGSQRLLENGAFRLHINGSPFEVVDALDELLETVTIKA